MALITDTSPTHTVPTPITALLVEPELSDRSLLEHLLLSMGFRVIVVETFHEARSPMDTELPRLLVTELRLGAYNGLHLVVRGKSRRADMAAIVTTQWVDPVLQAEADQLGATFVPKPVADSEFLAAVARTCVRGPKDPLIRPPFERRQTMRRVGSLPTAYEQDRRVLVERRRSVMIGS